MIRNHTLAAIAAAGSIAACQGLIGEPGATPGGPAARADGAADPRVGSDGGPDPRAACEPLVPEPAPTLLLTRVEYDNTVRDLLGDHSAPAATLRDDSHATVFTFNSLDWPDQSAVEKYMLAAEQLAATATRDARALVRCAAGTEGTDACARDFIARFGRRAFRRPLTADEQRLHEALYATARGTLGADFANAVRVVLAAMLQSPAFLYRVERGVPGAAARDGVVPLTPYEVASRLSYFLWRSTPDDALLDAAARDELATPAQLEAQARRLLADPRAADATATLAREWLDIESLAGLERNQALFPGADAALGREMIGETERFVSHVLLEGDGRLDTLMRGPFSFVTPRLAALYGVAPPAATTGFARVALDPAQRGGLLTQASVLTAQSKAAVTSPTRRGVFVLRRLLCLEVPNPPPDITVDPDFENPALSARDRLARHSTEPSCALCHRRMDPIGLGFEAYDAIGRHRTRDGMHPVDDRGELSETDVRGPFRGPIELSGRLLESRTFRDCVADRATAFALGPAAPAPFSCAQAAIRQRFAAVGYNLRDLMVSVAVSDAFRTRRPVPVEGACR